MPTDRTEIPPGQSAACTPSRSSGLRQAAFGGSALSRKPVLHALSKPALAGARAGLLASTLARTVERGELVTRVRRFQR